MERMQIVLYLSLIYILSLVNGQIIFPGQEEEDAILRSLNLEPNTLTRTTVNRFGFCDISNDRSGECLPYSQCSEMKKLVGRNGLSNAVIRIIRSRLCSVMQNGFKLCCETDKSRTFTPVVTSKPVTPNPRIPGNSASTSNLIPTENECGFATTTRIVDGIEYPHGSQPWLVGLGTLSSDGKFDLQCGGALITRRHVLSASHCFLPSRVVEPISHAIMGEHSLTKETERQPPIILRVIRRNSPGYNTRTHINDLELLELESDVDFTVFIRPVCLPFGFENENFIGKSMTIIGWGDTFFRSDQGNDVPLRADVPIIPRDECDAAYRRSPVINIKNSQICASSVKRDACQGDSGGPFLYEGTRTYLAGIVSFGVDCAGGTFPGVYTFIPHYLNWIRDNL